jgi:hypothetical protein
MSILYLIGILLLVGLLLWVVQALPWIDAGVKKIIYIVIVLNNLYLVVVGIWLISTFFGVSLGSLGNVHR